MVGVGKYYCSDCDWSGLRPNCINTKKKDGSATIHSSIYSCPVCRERVKYIASK